ncbi:MAG: hypothetical protein AABY01_04995 [Nanoarchaeota archaeon]
MWSYLEKNSFAFTIFEETQLLLEDIQTLIDHSITKKYQFQKTAKQLTEIQDSFHRIYEIGPERIDSMFEAESTTSGYFYRDVKEICVTYQQESKPYIEQNPQFSATLILLSSQFAKLNVNAKKIRELSEHASDLRSLHNQRKMPSRN